MKKKLAASLALIEDLVAGSRILAGQGVLDAYGHISARSDKRPEHFIMSRSRAPALVTAADLMELDAGSEPLAGDKRKGFIERYIHGEIYRARPEVMAVVHSHSPSVIPFGVTRTRLRPVYHMGSFLWSGAPVFDIRKVREENDLLIRDKPLGKALAATRQEGGRDPDAAVIGQPRQSAQVDGVEQGHAQVDEVEAEGVGGLAVHGWGGAAMLLVVTVFLAWLAVLSWPTLQPSTRVLRVVALAALLALSVWVGLR